MVGYLNNNNFIYLNMTQNSDILKLILKPQFHSRSEILLEACSPNELKGLKLISAIFKHKGKRKFRNSHNSSNASVPNMKSSETELRKRALVSTYESEFSYRANAETNILQYRKLSELQLSEILTPISVMFIESWIDLKDDIKLQNLVMDCLRSLNAIIKSTGSGVSENHKAYQWNDPTKNLKPHRLDQVYSSMSKRSHSTIKPWVRPSSAQPVDTKITPVTFTKEDLNRRKQALILGSGVIGKWVVAPINPNVSHYQETYTTHFNRYQKTPVPDKYTSISAGRMCPNPDQNS